MVGWVRGATGLSELDAYQFVSQNAKAPIIQLVDPEYTVLVKIEKKRLLGLAARAPGPAAAQIGHVIRFLEENLKGAPKG